MNNGVIIWLIIFALSAAGFFIIAVIVSINGFADLRSLLQHSDQRNKTNANLEKEAEKASE